ncbi:MAG TPA: YopX family protein [Candidatus Saccharimonadales bacterium]|nr:YopX family protein [Candidatus Saccharimonadales bacterium]
MREIKFRGKRYKKGDSGDDWVYGDFYHSTDGRACIDQWAVKPNTVGQYTGLKDKNGVEIYEGDVVRYHYLKNHFSLHQIIYEEKAAAFLLFGANPASRHPVYVNI